jgi:hypothetical protein
MPRTKVALFGAGFIADVHLESYKRFVPDAEVTSIYSRSPERAKRAAAHWGIPRWFSDLDRAIAEADCDVVDICLPNFLHHRVALAAARAASERDLRTSRVLLGAAAFLSLVLVTRSHLQPAAREHTGGNNTTNPVCFARWRATTIPVAYAPWYGTHHTQSWPVRR